MIGREHGVTRKAGEQTLIAVGMENAIIGTAIDGVGRIAMAETRKRYMRRLVGIFIPPGGLVYQSSRLSPGTSTVRASASSRRLLSSDDTPAA